MHFVSPYIYIYGETVIVLAFLTQENKAGKIQSTINQLKYGKGRAVRAIMVLGVVYGYLDHTPRTIIARTALPCSNTYIYITSVSGSSPPSVKLVNTMLSIPIHTKRKIDMCGRGQR